MLLYYIILCMPDICLVIYLQIIITTIAFTIIDSLLNLSTTMNSPRIIYIGRNCCARIFHVEMKEIPIQEQEAIYLKKNNNAFRYESLNIFIEYH